jgi:hypothetical protein
LEASGYFDVLPDVDGSLLVDGRTLKRFVAGADVFNKQRWVNGSFS